jgi:two-component system cell cycle response regulator
MAQPPQATSSATAEPSGQIILVLRNLLAERYPDLGKHVHTVARRCGQMAQELRMPLHERRALAQAAFLHDIGKLSLPESILNKAGPLDAEEWRRMRLHTIIGERILVASGLHRTVTALVRSSHERFDGTGYPDGLAGEAIPLGARIIAVCDAYDAMTSSRPYRPRPMTSDAASVELMHSTETQFDGAVVDAMVRLLSREERASGRPALAR